MELRDMTEPQLRDLMNQLAAGVNRQLPPGTLFCLLVFDDPGVTQYVSNAERASIIAALRETADRFEQQQVIPR